MCFFAVTGDTITVIVFYHGNGLHGNYRSFTAVKILQGNPRGKGFTYMQSMDFQRESQSKHHLYCKQEKPAHCHGSLLLRLGTHQIQNRTRDAHKISPHGTVTKRTPAMN